MNFEKIAIYDSHNKLYVQCWTEGNTIFLTDKFDKIESYKTLKEANSMLDSIISERCRFLNDKNESDINDPVLEVVILDILVSHKNKILCENSVIKNEFSICEDCGVETEGNLTLCNGCKSYHSFYNPSYCR